MTDVFASAVYGALAISSLSLVVWSALFVRVIRGLRRRHEQRAFVLVMPLVGMIASIGTLASAIGFGISSGTMHLSIPQEALTLIASMGRGALLMGGVIALAFYSPKDSPNG